MHRESSHGLASRALRLAPAWPHQNTVSGRGPRNRSSRVPPMAIPPVLRSLLTAHGPSGYETAPAAIFRDAASAFADVVTVIDGEPIELPNGRAVSRSMDNRLGCYVAYEAARLVSEAGGAPGDVVAVAAVQEETTFAGAATTAYALRPDVAIIVDVTHATDAPGVEPAEIGAHPFGSGPVIERGSNLNPRIVETLYETAEAEGIPFTVQASARATGTDLDAIHLSRGGVPCGGIGIPLRYMHSPVEMVQLDDVDNAAKLVAAVARR